MLPVRDGLAGFGKRHADGVLLDDRAETVSTGFFAGPLCLRRVDDGEGNSHAEITSGNFADPHRQRRTAGIDHGRHQDDSREHHGEPRGQRMPPQPFQPGHSARATVPSHEPRRSTLEASEHPCSSARRPHAPREDRHAGVTATLPRLPKSPVFAGSLTGGLAIVGRHDPLHQRMAHDIRRIKEYKSDPLNLFEPIDGVYEAAARRVGQVNLRNIAGYDNLRAVPHAGQKHLHLRHWSCSDLRRE